MQNLKGHLVLVKVLAWPIVDIFKDILASSNLSDIKLYCEENNIKYLTTMDFITEAFLKGILNEAEFDYFIYNVKTKGSKLPNNTIKKYLEEKGIEI